MLILLLIISILKPIYAIKLHSKTGINNPFNPQNLKVIPMEIIVTMDTKNKIQVKEIIFLTSLLSSIAPFR